MATFQNCCYIRRTPQGSVHLEALGSLDGLLQRQSPYRRTSGNVRNGNCRGRRKPKTQICWVSFWPESNSDEARKKPVKSKLSEGDMTSVTFPSSWACNHNIMTTILMKLLSFCYKFIESNKYSSTIVSRVFHLPTPWGGEVQDPGNDILLSLLITLN